MLAAYGAVMSVEAARCHKTFNICAGGSNNSHDQWLHFPLQHKTETISHHEYTELAVANLRAFLEHVAIPFAHPVFKRPIGRPDLPKEASQQVVRHMDQQYYNALLPSRLQHNAHHFDSRRYPDVQCSPSTRGIGSPPGLPRQVVTCKPEAETSKHTRCHRGWKGKSRGTTDNKPRRGGITKPPAARSQSAAPSSAPVAGNASGAQAPKEASLPSAGASATPYHPSHGDPAYPPPNWNSAMMRQGQQLQDAMDAKTKELTEKFNAEFAKMKAEFAARG